jgi:hypothetical protein
MTTIRGRFRAPERQIALKERRQIPLQFTASDGYQSLRLCRDNVSYTGCVAVNTKEGLLRQTLSNFRGWGRA